MTTCYCLTTQAPFDNADRSGLAGGWLGDSPSRRRVFSRDLVTYFLGLSGKGAIYMFCWARFASGWRLVWKPAILLVASLLTWNHLLSAQPVGNCEFGQASADLDVNNVRARLYNNGQLFWKGSGNVYTVPKDGEANSIFAAGIWIGGLDEAGELRFAGTAYGPFEYWPGPLSGDGAAPVDCSVYDRMYKISRSDIEAYDRDGVLADDLRDWPFDLGAPVTDGDGNPDNYNLAGGDRPEMIGDQMIWWVMNDVGNDKRWSKTLPIGLEIHVTAFAFEAPSEMANTTFYRYHIKNANLTRMKDIYFGVWMDPDLGNAADDFIGSDSTLGLGYVYNGDDFDEGFDGYQNRPPALGIDFVQGPLVPDASGNDWVDPDGTVFEGRRRIPMEVFMSYLGIRDPRGSSDAYDLLKAYWPTGTRLTEGGFGLGGSKPTNFMFSGDPVKREFWSEENTDGLGSRNTPSDRYFVVSTGPFDLNARETQDIIFAIIWSQAGDRLASVTQLKNDDAFVQTFYESNFAGQRSIDAPVLRAQPVTGGAILEWYNPESSNNYLEIFEERSFSLVTKPLTQDVTHSFEGYIVYQFDSETDVSGRIVAVFDVVNDVKGITELSVNPVTSQVEERVTIVGTDSGIQRSMLVDSLSSYQDYYFGVQAYAYNENSFHRVRRSDIVRVKVTPSPQAPLAGGTLQNAAPGDSLVFEKKSALGDSNGLIARVDNPFAVRSDVYEVRIDTFHTRPKYEWSDWPVKTTFSISRKSDDAVLIDGRAIYDSTGRHVEIGDNVFGADGLTFSINSTTTDFRAFETVANANGIIDPPTGAAADFQGFPVPERPDSSQQMGEGVWLIGTGDNGSRGSYQAFIGRSIRQGWGPVTPFDWEIRFTAQCYNTWRTNYDAGTPYATPADGCYAYDRFGIFGDDRPTLVPFELWNIGIDTADDPSDDFRVVPAVIDWDGDGYDLQWFDHSGSSLDNDPEVDWVYWYNPVDLSPGTVGYDLWQADLLAGTTSTNHANEIMARYIWFNWNGGSIGAATDKADYLANVVDQDMPEAGTVFRLVTSKPLADGDVFNISTSDVVASRGDAATAQEALDLIGIVPNPYKGVSAYEVDLTSDKARFTNLPTRATIRVFSLAGTLVKTIEKNSPAASLEWDLTTDESLPLASGMYLIHVEVPGVGEKVIKFGFIKKRVQLDLI